MGGQDPILPLNHPLILGAMKQRITRRTFLKQAAATGAGLGVFGHLNAVRGIAAPSSKIVVAVMGVNSRGRVLAETCARAEGCEVAWICDVDERAIGKTIQAVSSAAPASAPKARGEADIRRVLENSDVDALVIAAPDHWHAPASILAMQAGKHVYVEKPCGHNCREGELLVEAQAKYGRVIQMGNQQRASSDSQRIIQRIREGLLGRAYYARAWYANTRGSIGYGKPAAVPDWLSWDLWQGPASRKQYTDNVVHYNWHWFWHWGTGEICNNGAHEIDICRWALGVDYPTRVTSSGGRFHFKDDWEFYDTQVASFDFAEDKTITWDGRSCNGRTVEGRGRGAAIHCENGTAILDRQGYVVYDQQNKVIQRSTDESDEATLDIRGGGSLTELHMANFFAAIRDGAQQYSPIDEGHKSTLLCHLGNIAQHTGRALICDPSNGHIQGDEEAMAMWGRSYEPGWEVIV